MRLDQQKFDQWNDWTSKIENDLTSILSRRKIFKTFMNVYEENRSHFEKHDDGLIFTDFVRRAYASYAILGIRRQIKTDEKSISLMRLLEQIKDCSSQFTYDQYLSFYPIDEKDANWKIWQQSTFTEISKDESIVSEEIIQEDIDTLNSSGKDIEGFADRVLAHFDKRGCDVSITYDDIDNAIDAFSKIAKKYKTVITSKGGDLEPVIPYNWENIFTVPMIPEKEES